jgi:hypothetical protein
MPESIRYALRVNGVCQSMQCESQEAADDAYYREVFRRGDTADVELEQITTKTMRSHGARNRAEDTSIDIRV